MPSSLVYILLVEVPGDWTEEDVLENLPNTWHWVKRGVRCYSTMDQIAVPCLSMREAEKLQVQACG